MTNPNNYRIKAITEENTPRYFPQKKFLFWWLNIFAWEPYRDGGYYSIQEAQKKLRDYLSEKTVEYYDVNGEKLK